MKLSLALRIVLVLVGVAIILLGLNVGLGGILTLGWQGPTDFVSVIDPAAFAVQDNHVRFLGGVWLGVGLVFIGASVFTEILWKPALVLCALVFLGGLMRLGAGDLSLLSGADIGPSLAAELVVFPFLAFWIARQARGNLR
mgnify:CR=1 FL=1